MDRISFTGIQNVRLLQKSYKQFGSYISPAAVSCNMSVKDSIKYGEKKYSEVILHCDLTDDAKGKHLNEFFDMLKKTKVQYQFNCVDSKNSEHIKLHMKRFDVDDELGHVTESEFKLNNYDIYLNNRETLPLFTFMARITREIPKLEQVSESVKKYLKFVNSSVHKKACEYIEMM